MTHPAITPTGLDYHPTGETERHGEQIVEVWIAIFDGQNGPETWVKFVPVAS
jgi:hypothetical protein